ncbi:cytochrome c oxidase assembly protein COX19-like [Nematostella vectensis]|uniref:cytochrome c oxidase assembly protein COX19-like n=1 Tax=Nematostella vectensis TaxID=45351 RepID=UPI002076FD21|nr:cytochrome c oxidase assembly protein COX19-like [Nematostella vectensis]
MNPSGRKIFQTKPPDRGSFPLDHDGECKDFMITYMQCLKKNKNMNFNCRAESQAYLQCRMDRYCLKHSACYVIIMSFHLFLLEGAWVIQLRKCSLFQV